MRYRAFGGLVVLTVVWACGLPGSSNDLDVLADGEGLTLLKGARIQYVGAFDWEGAARWEQGYAFETDLGYRFRIEQLWVATHSVQLRVCDEELALAPRWGFRVARADHVVEDDASIAIVDRAEDALAGTLSDFGLGTAADASYCQAFVLATGLSEQTSELGHNVIGVAGSYWAPLGTSWVAFDARIPLGEGTLADLQANASPLGESLQLNGEAADLSVIMTRYPVRAFAKARPDLVSEAEFAWMLLGELLHTSTASYHVR